MHILHISTADEIEIIKKHKKYITCEVTPQHLFFSSPQCYEKLGSLSQMNPPIRNKIHQNGLWKGISKKIVDVIGSDHAPYNGGKTCTLSQFTIWNGRSPDCSSDNVRFC